MIIRLILQNALKAKWPTILSLTEPIPYGSSKYLFQQQQQQQQQKRVGQKAY